MEMSAAALGGKERLMPGPSRRDELQGNPENSARTSEATLKRSESIPDRWTRGERAAAAAFFVRFSAGGTRATDLQSRSCRFLWSHNGIVDIETFCTESFTNPSLPHRERRGNQSHLLNKLVLVLDLHNRNNNNTLGKAFFFLLFPPVKLVFTLVLTGVGGG